jgi:His/Glu/Gln/Arg/opine family amino acid ABC transporter permease subunit
MFDLDGYSYAIFLGLEQTLLVGLLAMLLACTIGVFGALAKTSSSHTLRIIASFYTATIRGIPELILLLLIFYGVPTLLQDSAASFGLEIIIDLNPFIAGVITLGFIYGAFSVEVFRGAFGQVPVGQLEAARAMGMRPWLIFYRILFPQALRFSIPGLSNVWMLLIKATALISVIQLDEVMRMTKIAANATQKPFTAYLFAALLFLAITLVSIVIQKYLENKYARGYQ